MGTAVFIMGCEAAAQCSGGSCAGGSQAGGPQIIITGHFHYGLGSSYASFLALARKYLGARYRQDRSDRTFARIQDGYYLYPQHNAPIPWKQPPRKHIQKGGVFVVPPRPAPSPRRMKDEPIAALVSLEREEPIYPKTFAEFLTVGDERFETGDWTGALEAYRAALKLNPGHPAALLALANTHFAVGDFIPASEALHDAMAIWPGIADVTHEIDTFYPEDKSFADYMQTLEETLARGPTDVRRLFLAGAMHALNGNAEQALDYLQTAQSLLPNDPVMQHQVQRLHANED